MTALYAAHNRRRRRKLYLLLAVVFTLILLLHSYVDITFNILFRGPYIARRRSNHMRITPDGDGFDITFDSYPRRPSSSLNTSLPVPPIMHHILLGKPKVDATGNANISIARKACMDLHPQYQFRYWTDDDAKEFVKNSFPKFFDMWLSYPFTIQKADSLRYMVLYEYGGIFLDLDLECRRPLDPLRKFDFVAPEATPMGISNGFLMVSPKHPFMKYVIENLPRYNVNWFLLPYATVMFSTGCHFLSTMLSLFPSRDSLKILWGPHEMHQLSGRVVTPLFKHLGMSSWHSFDGALVAVFKPGRALSITSTSTWIKFGVLALSMTCFTAWYRRRSRRRNALAWQQAGLKETV